MRPTRAFLYAEPVGGDGVPVTVRPDVNDSAIGESPFCAGLCTAYGCGMFPVFERIGGFGGGFGGAVAETLRL